VRREELIALPGDKESIDNAATEKIKFKKKFLGEDTGEEEIVAAPQVRKKKKEFQPLPLLETLRPPEPDVWMLEKPHISAKQDDIIKLSAQFVARNGRSFQNGLMEREHKVHFFSSVSSLRFQFVFWISMSPFFDAFLNGLT
jgi:hypothetical protein